jgi:MFS family permease
LPLQPSRRSQRGLDWFVFFVATVLTGFGPFVAVYLTSQHWTQLDIGLVLSIGGVASLLGQMPSGALVDAARSERVVAGLAIVATGASALALGFWPVSPVVQVASVVQAFAGCILGPAIAAISLGLVGHEGIGERASPLWAPEPVQPRWAPADTSSKIEQFSSSQQLSSFLPCLR